MQRRFLFSALLSLTSLSLAGLAQAQAPMPLRVLTHSSFDLPKELLAQFEKDAGVRLQIVKAGDAGEMTNKLILTKAKPIADVAYGIDNTLLPRALAAGVVEPYTGPAAQRAAAVSMDGGVVPVDFGYVNLNIDKAWFAKKGLALPASLDDLAKLDSIAMSAPEGRSIWNLIGPGGVHQMVQHTPRYVADDLLTLKYAAVAGTGVCWMPDYMCQEEMRERKLVRVLPDWAPAPAIVHAVFPSRRGLSPAVRRFLDYLGEAMPGRSSVSTRQALQGLDGANI